MEGKAVGGWKGGREGGREGEIRRESIAGTDILEGGSNKVSLPSNPEGRAFIIPL